jgi:hypothetical protein
MASQSGTASVGPVFDVGARTMRQVAGVLLFQVRWLARHATARLYRLVRGGNLDRVR